MDRLQQLVVLPENQAFYNRIKSCDTDAVQTQGSLPNYWETTSEGPWLCAKGLIFWRKKTNKHLLLNPYCHHSQLPGDHKAFNAQLPCRRLRASKIYLQSPAQLLWRCHDLWSTDITPWYIAWTLDWDVLATQRGLCTKQTPNSPFFGGADRFSGSNSMQLIGRIKPKATRRNLKHLEVLKHQRNPWSNWRSLWSSRSWMRKTPHSSSAWNMQQVLHSPCSFNEGTCFAWICFWQPRKHKTCSLKGLLVRLKINNHLKQNQDCKPWEDYLIPLFRKVSQESQNGTIRSWVMNLVLTKY